MNTLWSLTCSAVPGWLALLLALGGLGAVGLLQERRAALLLVRMAAALLAVGLLADLTLSRTTTALVPPPVAVVLDVSASMGTVDRQLPTDRRLDWAMALHVIDGRRRSVGPRRMAAVLTTVQQRIPTLITSTGTAAGTRSTVDGLRELIAELDAAAAGGSGYRDAERLCRDAASALAAVAEAPAGPREHLAPLVPAITALLPRLAAEQTAGDDALLSGWQAAQDPDAAAVELLATTTRGGLAARLVREQLLPLLAQHGTTTTFSLSDRLFSVTPSSLAPGAGGTDFAALADLARSWETTATLGALVLVSDGRNLGGDPRPALRALQARGARIVLIGVGDSGAPGDAALIDLDGPEIARAGTRMTLSAMVRQGTTPGWSLVLAADDVEVARQELAAFSSPGTVGATAGTTTQRITIEAGQPGLRHVTAHLERAADSGAILSGPLLTCPIRIIDHTVRVVVVDGVPRWETRALIAALEADPLVTVERRFLQGPAPVSSALPTATLSTADAVVLGDLTPAELSSADQTRLAEFVADGGFLLVVAGPRGMPAGFALGPLADLLPITPVRDGAPPAPGATLALTTAGEVHRVCHLLTDSDLDRRLWAALPGPDWLAGNLAARPEATVLVSAATGPGSTIPAIVVSAVGAGQVLWFGIPESWRWQAFSRGRAHTAFWTNALRWGTATQPRGSDPRLRVALSPARINAQDSSELLIACTPPAEPQATMTDHDGHQQQLALALQGAVHGLGRWRAEIPDASEGLHRITVRTAVGSDELHEERDLLVRPLAARELADPTADLRTLRLLADDLGATYSDISGATDAISDVAQRLAPHTVSTVTTWRFTGGPWAAGILILALSLEWLLRKRSGLP